jgi:benzoyl-CoA reductase/2-hydroxyglutaryl-CoA dehydratase subunit BcrC/BadD/HgdB
MLNKQEEPEALKSYDLEELVKPENFLEISDIVDEKMEQLMKKMEEIQEETEGQVKVDSNKTLH